MNTAAEKLVELAIARFGLITRPERKMLEDVAVGRPANFQEHLNTKSSRKTDVLTQSTQRTISADVLRWLCADKEASALISPPGITIIYALINGELNLAGLNFPYRFGLLRCEIKDGLVMQDTQVQTLSLQGSYCKYLIADRLKANGSVYLRFNFRSEGPVILANASIKGDLDCTSGLFNNPDFDDVAKENPQFSLARRGISLAVDRSSIEGDIYLRLGFKSYGEVRLVGTTIKGNLDCRGGCFYSATTSATNIALRAEIMRVSGFAGFQMDPHSKEKFQTDGVIMLNGTSIGGFVNFNKAIFLGPRRNGLELKNVIVGGPLVWKSVAINKTTILRLSHAKVGQLSDDKGSWPRKNRLSLNGFVYDDIRGAPVISEKRKKWLQSRLDWLKRQPRSEFSLQPYKQLSEALRRTGYEDNARTILISMYDERRKRGGLSNWGYVWSILIKVTIGYGYRSHRAFAWALGFVILGCLILFEANKYNLMSPTKANTPIVTRFNSVAYSLETFLPIINLRQRESWAPNTTDNSGYLLQVYLWCHIIIGWVLTTLGIVGFTGLIKKE